MALRHLPAWLAPPAARRCGLTGWMCAGWCFGVGGRSGDGDGVAMAMWVGATAVVWMDIWPRERGRSVGGATGCDGVRC